VLACASVRYYNDEFEVKRASFGRSGSRLLRHDPEVAKATTVLDDGIDRLLSAALAQRIRGADAIKTK
jgi:hypothetical protein